MQEPDMVSNTGACILAAGYSSRMGSFKPLLPLGERTALEVILEKLTRAGIGTTIVVTGHNREQLTSVIKKYGACEVFNPDYSKGMFTSIQAGTEQLKKIPGLAGFFLIPVDSPLIDIHVMETLKGRAGVRQMTVPCYMGKKGHPLYIPISFAKDISSCRGNRGMKDITDKYVPLRIDTGFEGAVMDMDDEEGYEKLLTYFGRGCTSERLSDMARGRRFIFIRHGSTQLHREKIFMGQTDVPLSDEGHRQAEAAGEKLAQLKPETDVIYSSDLLRAAETACIAAEKAKGLRVIREKGLREMALGDWDGEFISVVKEKYPEEYRQRGEDIFRYKFDHGSENFFDLQYRVVSCLKDILRKDDARDIIITAHSGVLRSLCNNLEGKDVSDNWDKMEKGEIRNILC